MKKEEGLESMKKINWYHQIQYVTRFPKNFDVSGKYPLLIVIHGAGARGRDIDLIYNYLAFDAVEERNLDIVTVAPQCYEDSWFSIFEQLQDFVKYAIGQDYVDKERVYIIGTSMGAYTTWQLGMSRPELFAAMVPICGGGMYWNASRLKNIPIWAFHGRKDPVVYCEESEKMVRAVNAAGGNAKLTIYEGVEHASWVKAYQEEEMWKWLLKQSRKENDHVEN